MSTLLEQASLVMIPSGYKEDVVYSQIPTNGNGDLSFTRASNGTRVNSAGLVEVVPWNILSDSENFTSSAYTNITTTVTANNTTAPNGTLTADKLEFTTTGSFLYQPNVGTNSATGCISVYLKADANTQIYIASNDLANWGTGVQLLCNVTTEWQRFEIGGVASNVNGFKSWVIGTVNPTNGGGGLSARTVYAWGAQSNIGSTAKPYFPTTDRLNVPRLTYQNGGGGCPSLLLEKQSTNLVIQSQALTISTVNVGYTATDNNTTSPDGTQNASRVLEDTGTLHLIQKPYSVGSTTDYYTASFFVKSISRAKGKIVYGLDGAPYNSIEANFDLTAQTISSPTASGSGAVAGSSKIENFGNGWFRVSISGIVGVSGTHYTRLVGLNDSGSDTYTGDPSKGFYAWGFQGEAGNYVTSYIPTTSSSATRVADACFKTGISSLIGQTEGVLFVDFEFVGYGSVAQWIAFLIGASGDYIGFYTNSSNKIVMEVATGVSQFLDVSITLNVGTRYKMAVAYKANDFAFYVNGNQISVDSSGSVPTCSEFNFNYNTTAANLANNKYNQAVLFKTRLTNAELASLTTI